METTMPKTLLIPGLDGSPAAHWQQWWALRDPDALLLDLSDVSRPVPAVWEIEVAGAILQHPGAILVGHSLGAILIARLLAKWPHLKVGGAILVAPAEPRHSDRTESFGPIFEESLGVPAYVVSSRNDPWMSFTQAERLARAWRADVVDLGFAGHINVDSGFGPWPGGVVLRDELARRPVPVMPPEQALERAFYRA
ncbi:RBBP9/YdeN family alpha/beta hydrolase [Cereibacter sphaeroides]|uniref:RBBP9/YdeN family alpha/beta hydrolase n=1 Tax=Cereibacter sphaeroides TaxID=1063 RepID=UPI00142D8EF9|nr:alpha/beta hydrolase [Cereibacter sphaeroides]